MITVACSATSFYANENKKGNGSAAMSVSVSTDWL